MTSYYDHILGLIPVAFAAVVATLQLTGFSTTIAIPTAGGVAVVLVAHALFVNGPVEDTLTPVESGVSTASAEVASESPMVEERGPISTAD